MLDGHGNLITNSQALDELTLEPYKDRLQTLQIRIFFLMNQMRREDLCKERLKEAQSVRTPDWSLQQLEIFIKLLKNKMSCYPLGLANELFRPINAGDDLEIAVLRSILDKLI